MRLCSKLLQKFVGSQQTMAGRIAAQPDAGKAGGGWGGAEFTIPTSGPITAHLILVGSWVAPPVLLLGGCVSATWPALGGPAAGVVGPALTAGLVVGPAHPLYRSAMCAALGAVAMTAEKGRRGFALAAAGGVAALTYLVGVKWRRSEAFFRLITETLRGRDYYSRVEVRGAVDRVQKGRNFFACHPHGCLSAGWTWSLFWNPDFHERTGRIGFFIDPLLRTRNPLFRMVCDWYEGDLRYAAAADKRNMKAAMQRGESLAIIPGGFEDATVMAFRRDRTVLRRRQGFVKYCLEEGYPITPVPLCVSCPLALRLCVRASAHLRLCVQARALSGRRCQQVYTFGESDTYWTFTGLSSVRMWFNKYKIPMAIFFGRWWLPVLPRKEAQLLTYVGVPLVLPKIESPSAADVEYWHGSWAPLPRPLPPLFQSPGCGGDACNRFAARCLHHIHTDTHDSTRLISSFSDSNPRFERGEIVFRSTWATGGAEKRGA